MISVSSIRRFAKPAWLKISVPPEAAVPKYNEVKSQIKSFKLATVCEEAKCPNIGECWASGTATIMLMGDTCTRGCRFCSVKTSKAPPPLDPNEPKNVAKTIGNWGLDYIVITSVDRDDLPDQGAAHIASTIHEIKTATPALLVEALVPDFRGELNLVSTIARAPLNVFAHNIETVERLTPSVRDRRAKYKQSMSVLAHAKQVGAPTGLLTKSSIMLGLGEADAEIEQTLADLRSNGVDLVTFGQYLQPTKYHLKVSRFVPPAEFDNWKSVAESMGFMYVASGPLVRSSYKAGEYYLSSILKNRTNTYRT